MPAEIFINFSTEDLGGVIAYLKTLPRVGKAQHKPDFGFLGRIMLVAGVIGKIFPAEYIDHNRPFPDMPAIGASVAYGRYFAGWCTACHGPDLHGAELVFAPEAPPAPDLAVVSAWSEAEFTTALRTGVAPGGRQIDVEYMPWNVFGQFSDEELKGLWLYLQTLAPGENGNE